jgi:DNA-binding XRE family transcriptional regulator
MCFGTKVRIARTKLSMNQTELAEKAKISRTYLSEIERNKAIPAFTLAVTISKLFPDEKLIEAYVEMISKEVDNNESKI